MKTFRMIGMALMAVLLSVNFAACSSDDDEPGGEGGGTSTSSKKLVEMSMGSLTMGFTYDGNQVSSITQYWDGSTYTYTYTWEEGLITEKDHYGEIDTYTLTNGLITSIESEYSFTYNSSKQLISEEWSDGPRDCRRDYTWKDGKLIKMVDTDEDKTIEFTYGNQTCKGYFPLLVERNVLIAHPELAGIRTSYLPSKKVTYYGSGSVNEGSYEYSYSYTFDSDGYIKTCTEKRSHDGEESTSVYSFKWQ